MKTIRLLISCPDARGIIAAVTSFVAEHGGNVLDADQHSDKQHGEFFMRVLIDPAGFALTPATFAAAWRSIADRFQMQWRIAWGDRRKRMAIFVSKAGHCLNDLLWRWKTNELEVHIPFVILNHDALRSDVESVGLPFRVVPITPENKAAQEFDTRRMLDEAECDFIVLARYMQILSRDFVAAMPNRIINIHHSFLPSFVGAKPYHQAYAKGVKLIGATCHYVTADLDQGPIIEQDVIRIDHTDSVEDMVRYGKDIEKAVLARGLRYHLEDRVLVHGNKTVVFR